MYAFLAKFEELNQNMKPVEELAAQMYPKPLYVNSMVHIVNSLT